MKKHLLLAILLQMSAVIVHAQLVASAPKSDSSNIREIIKNADGSTEIVVNADAPVSKTNQKALIVVDGVIVNQYRYFNPEQIKSVIALNEDAATALYGSAGANGAIVLTTKSK